MIYEKKEQDSDKPLKEQLEAIDKLNGLLVDLSKEENATFDRILKDRPKFSSLP